MAGLTGKDASESKSEADNENQKHFDVIVIGAGMAGLAAAQKLRKELPDHFSLIVLEARDRIGGRIHTVQDVVDGDTGNSHACISVDMGATWIHGHRGNPMAKIAKQIDTKILLDDEETLIITEKGLKISGDRVKEYQSKFDELVEDAKEYSRCLDHSISLKEAIEQVDPSAFNDPIMQYFIGYYIEFEYGGCVDNIAASMFDTDSEFAGADAIPLKGYKPILEELARELDIRLDVAVKVVRHSLAEGVHLETNKGLYKAEKVICTIPLGVLKKGLVEFDPPLSPAKQIATNRLGLGTVNKVALLFDKVFWPRDPHGFGVIYSSVARKYPYIINKYAISKIPMLEVYSVGKYAAVMEEKSDNEIVKDVLDLIAAMFATKSCGEQGIRGSLVKSYISRWGKEKYTQGAYTFCSTETLLDDFWGFLEDENNSLFFGGEHTTRQWRGTVHGAYFSGQHAAKQVIESFEGY